MVNQQFTFAVHILAVLGYSGDKVDSGTVAASVNTNPVVVRRLLLALRRAGLVDTVTGKHGGAKLRRAPGQISLLDIYDAIEPRPVISVNERKALRKCPVSCSMKHLMAGVAQGTEQAMRAHLRRITLQQLLHKIR